VAVTLADGVVESRGDSTPGDSIIDAHDIHSRMLRLGVLAVIVGVVLIHVPFPFWGDQALFAYGAHGLRHGDRLYVDIWDVKQPGIYLWYLVSGSVFGFHEGGIHLAELIWSVAFAVCIQRVMRGRVANRWVADIAPLLTVGAFYAAARGWDLTQIEYLVAFPLLLSLWAAADAGDGPGRSRLLFASGVAASVVGYFKLVYVLIPLAFWIYLLVERRRDNRSRETGRDSVRLLAGLAVPLLPLLGYFVQQHLLGTMWWTYVTYPPKVVRSLDPPPLSRLRAGAWYFVENFAWLGVFATAAVGALRAPAARRRDPLMVGLAMWFVLGSGTILIQNRWGYLFMLLVVPLGLFACYGIDRLCSGTLRPNFQDHRQRVPTRTVALVLCAALLALYPAKQVAHKVKTLVSDDFALSASGRQKYDDTFAPYYAQARAAAAFVRQPGRTPGPIHVEGNPLIQYLSGRDFALREQGWAPEQSDTRLWSWTRRELRDRRPVYLWLDQFSGHVMRSRSRETLLLIDTMYCSVQTIGDGTWYALRGSHDCAPPR
jgi:hypothetical protein